MSGLPQIWTVPSSGGWPELVTAFDDPIGEVEWSPEGKWLAFSLAPGGGMNSQIHIVHPDGSGLRRLTPGGKDNNWIGPWSRDGHSLAFASNVRSADSMDAMITGVDGPSRLVARNPGVGYLVDISRDNKTGLLNRSVSRGNNDLYAVDLSSGKETLLTPHQGTGSFEGALSPSGDTVYLLSDREHDLAAFAKIKRSDPKSVQTLASRPDAELESFVISDDGSTAALLWNKAGKSELSMMDLTSGKERPVSPLPAEIIAEASFSRDGRLLAVTATGPASPRDIWILDVPSGKFRQLTHSPHAGVDLQTLVRPELRTYKGEDGLALSGWLYRPAGASGAGPIVLNFHGGPEGEDRPTFNSTYQALLSRGISVFAPNVRGSSGFGKKFVNLDNGALRVGSVRDIKSSVDYLISSSIADPAKIGIMGGSYGGYMVMAGLTQYPKMFAAGADLFGVVNFETFFKNTEPWMAAISTIEYGDPKTEAAMLRDLSPLTRVDQVIAPTIVLHGANDTNVPVIEAEQVVASLKKRNVPVQYVLFPDEGHGWNKTPNRIRSTVEIVNWFTKYLK